MRGPVLEYSSLPSRRKHLRFAIFLFISILVVASGWMGFRMLHTELALRQEARRLLAINAPVSRFPNCSPTLASGGRIVLPDGRMATIAELDLAQASQSGSTPTVAAAVTNAIRRLQAVQCGYTVVGSDSSGAPVVQLWVLSPRAYMGICGNSSHEERRQARMMVSVPRTFQLPTTPRLGEGWCI